MPSIMQPLREEHQELLPQIEHLRAVADVIGDASVETLQRAVDEVYAFLTLHLIPHAHAEDAALYPVIGKVMGAARFLAKLPATWNGSVDSVLLPVPVLVGCGAGCLQPRRSVATSID